MEKKDMGTRKIYIVASQTGSVLARAIKVISSKEYSHSSIATEADLSDLCSFGRRHAYNPFFGGFVTESVYYGTFKRFKNTSSLIIEVEVDEDNYQAIEERLEYLREYKEKYDYDILGLFLAAFHIYYTRQYHYYCSQFVRDTLIRSHVKGSTDLSRICHPMDFLQLPNARVIYAGKLRNYPYMYQEA